MRNDEKLNDAKNFLSVFESMIKIVVFFLIRCGWCDKFSLLLSRFAGKTSARSMKKEILKIVQMHHQYGVNWKISDS